MRKPARCPPVNIVPAPGSFSSEPEAEPLKGIEFYGCIVQRIGRVAASCRNDHHDLRTYG